MNEAIFENTPEPECSKELISELHYLRRISESDTAKILELDSQSIAIRHELEQKRRGFVLLAELAVSLRERSSYESVFVPVARRIDAALNMQRTAVLVPQGDGRFTPAVLQGYPSDRKDLVAARSIEIDAELLDPERPVLVTGADPDRRLAALRQALELPYLISCPAFLYDNEVAAILITGRVVEEPPFLSRLGRTDVETVQAISALLAAVLVEQRLESELRRARDQAEKSARAKSEFLANMSHEIRTPINAILGMIHFLDKTEMTETQRRYANQAEQSTRLLLRVIDDILDFSSIETGRMELKLAEFSLHDMAERVCSHVAEEAERKSLSLDLRVEPDVPDLLIGDSLRVEQVLLNLVHNAVKFTRRGGAAIGVSRQANSDDKERHTIRLLFDVKDTGVGMDEEQAGKLFMPFTQGDASHTRKYGGTGLGLAVSRSLVELMGGEIGCESRLGEGSRFFFSIPFALPKEAAEPSVPCCGHSGKERSEEETEGDTENMKGMHVLLAEDNEINQMIVVELLRDAGVTVTAVENGLEAVKAVEKEPFDLVLMDIQMPEMDGLTATMQIHANPKYKDLPIIALTAHALPEDRETSLKSGMNEHLTKPVDPDEIYAALRQWGKRKKGLLTHEL
ncbi:MAG: response regulator [Synergistaceae bacterium]|jgi:signal transduction histidine kinase/CheY-like chemotaxis protein|nr:response regulator [Synergistaceae bacterium]